ncbi:MAG: hypothetical protein O3C10_12095 [Chloroflexi bacterium]|nr:hypothetical protein [Chloroflexota bacterium]
MLLFPLARWGLPRLIGWMGARHDRKQAEERAGGPVIEGRLARPTRDLREVDPRELGED